MKNFLSLLLVVVSVYLSAQVAPSYYNSVDFTLEGEALKNDLTQLMNSSHDTYVDYGELWEILQQSDLNPENSEDVLLMYGWDDTNAEDDDDYSRDKDDTCGNGNPCTDETWNREHVYPKALDQSSSDDDGPTADPHMLRSCDVEMNGSRANRAFEAGNGIASYITNNGNFYPGDNWKGDVARIIMYMYVHYGEDWNPNYVGEDTNSYHADMPDIFLEWNAEDPVSTYEMDRNDIVEGYQGNRNPFIDNPYLATVIWGGPAADNTWPDTLSTNELTFAEVQIYPNPTNDVFHIKGIQANSKIYVYNVVGQRVASFKNTNTIVLNVSGVYFVQIVDENQKMSFKVIKR